jgi:hypothetical protein
MVKRLWSDEKQLRAGKSGMQERRPWTTDDVARLKIMAGKIPTAQIARELGRGHSATVMKAHSLGVSLRLIPKRGSRQAGLIPEAGLTGMDLA